MYSFPTKICNINLSNPRIPSNPHEPHSVTSAKNDNIPITNPRSTANFPPRPASIHPRALSSFHKKRHSIPAPHARTYTHTHTHYHPSPSRIGREIPRIAAGLLQVGRRRLAGGAAGPRNRLYRLGADITSAWRSAKPQFSERDAVLSRRGLGLYTLTHHPKRSSVQCRVVVGRALVCAGEDRRIDRRSIRERESIVLLIREVF